MSILEKVLKKDKVVDVNVEDLETEGKNRLELLSPTPKKVAMIIGIIWTVFQIYTGLFGLMPAVLQRSTTMGFAVSTT